MANPLIEPEALSADLEAIQVFDVRWRLNDPDHGRSAYVKAHIPGAVFVDLDSDLSGPPGPGGRHPLPSVHQFERTLGRLGIGPSSRVAVYDDVSGMVASRMWWMLQSVGHTSVQLLNGGLHAWVNQEWPVEAGEVSPAPTAYPLAHGFRGVVDAEMLSGRTVLDVRAAERYRGDFEPVDPRPGHIPGAINLPADIALEEQKFRRPEDLVELYSNLSEPIVSCGSGVVACHTALAMASAGLPVPDVYIGSYSEWSRSERPVHTGPTP